MSAPGYVGQRLNGKMHGRGKNEWANKDRYEGEYVHDKMHGRGVYTFKNGEVYDGEWKEDKHHGQGRFTWPDGRVYEGTYVDGVQEGTGVFTTSTGVAYTTVHRAGKEISREVEKNNTSGRISGDCTNGFGKWRFQSGSVYEGTWRDGKMHGRGKFTWADKDRYEGEYVAGKMEGRGVYHFKNGEVYDGEWAADKRQGQGRFTWPDGRVYEGPYVNGVQEGAGVFTTSTGKVYKTVHRGGKEVSRVEQGTAREHAVATDEPDFVEDSSRGGLPEIFISFRFGEAMTEGLALKKALESRGARVFLCSEKPGADVKEVIVENIDACRLAVIMGSRTYGSKGTTKFSTREELNFIIEEEKPRYLVKMCDRFDDAMARFSLGKTVLYKLWIPKTESEKNNPPADLVTEILEKLAQIK